MNRNNTRLKIIESLIDKSKSLSRLAIDVYGEPVPHLVFICPKCEGKVAEKITSEFNETNIISQKRKLRRKHKTPNGKSCRTNVLRYKVGEGVKYKRKGKPVRGKTYRLLTLFRIEDIQILDKNIIRSKEKNLAQNHLPKLKGLVRKIEHKWHIDYPGMVEILLKRIKEKQTENDEKFENDLNQMGGVLTTEQKKHMQTTYLDEAMIKKIKKELSNSNIIIKLFKNTTMGINYSSFNQYLDTIIRILGLQHVDEWEKQILKNRNSLSLLISYAYTCTNQEKKFDEFILDFTLRNLT